MSIPVITEEDLTELKLLTPDLDFTDAERREVLLATTSGDVNAAPGSGKTTVLAAKLLLFARKWPHDSRGICVLSHTNVAREAIQTRLAATAIGARLLAYPHFIGTIHGFIDRFLALPALRSIGQPVDVIDDEVFANKAISRAMKNGSLKYWAQNDESIRPMIGGLIYRGPDLVLSSEGGTLPGLQSKTYPLLKEIKEQLAREGVFRYADMFAYAELLLKRFPGIKTRLSNRFPLVCLDEMQDTSWEQETLLKRLFDDTTVIQRYGDINQRILVGKGDFAQLSFPKTGALSISTSKRFGPAIAAAVSGAQVCGKPVVGTASDIHQPTLITYSTECVGHVLHHFGRLVLNRFKDEQLNGRPIKALCTRKQGDAQTQIAGRTLIDYWPAFMAQAKGAGGRSERLWSLLIQPPVPVTGGLPLQQRAADIKQAVLLVLRECGSPHIAGIRDGTQIFRRLADTGQDIRRIRRLCRELTISPDLGVTDDGRARAIDLFIRYLLPLAPAGMKAEQFQALPVFDAPEWLHQEDKSQRTCRVVQGERAVEIEIGTVASMKGETHLATLVLESLGHPSRRFDLEEALPVLAGLKVLDPRLKETILSQFRNLYVGMSRPTDFLCLAANRSRVSPECITALQRRGWTIEVLT